MIALDFDATVREFMPSLRAAAVRLTGNTSDADDVLQDALIRALAAWRTFDQLDGARRWLRVIIKRCFLDECRKRGHRRTEPETDAADEGITGWTDYIDAQRALEHLRPEYRAVLELAMVGCSHDEISVTLGIPVGTSFSRLSRARRELDARLE